MISETGFFSKILTPNHESLKKPGFLVRAYRLGAGRVDRDHRFEMKDPGDRAPILT